MNLKPEQIPDEVVDEALFCTPWNSYDEPMAMPIDLMAMGSPERLEEARTAMRHALAAALPVLLGEPVAWMDPASRDVINAERKHEWMTYFGAGGKVKAELYTLPLYTLPTQDTPNEN